MNTIEISITGTEFEFNGVKYDAKYAINKDKRLIITEAMDSHKEVFEKEYDKDIICFNVYNASNKCWYNSYRK